jgi:hypothetical protein
LFLFWFTRMWPIDIFNLLLSSVSLYGIVNSLWRLLPRNIVPLVLTLLNEAMALLEHPGAIYIPNMSDYWANLAMYAHSPDHVFPRLTERSFHNQFLQMRTESHRSLGFFQQLCLLFCAV